MTGLYLSLFSGYGLNSKIILYVSLEKRGAGRRKNGAQTDAGGLAPFSQACCARFARTGPSPVPFAIKGLEPTQGWEQEGCSPFSAGAVSPVASSGP